ncbi:uncharacterized protein LOC122638637 [Telopea speciosissima]|uniref:uncharacterized protein LOC122638637 n=1 Tax=Telopea speciosissima TaxID=54955 RepID=UPI001CC5851B|nr:uncharacterized protein LOC122638637 [Telopea speciosissima]
MAAFFLGIKEAQELEMQRVWVECDSATVVNGILASNMPWEFIQRWWSIKVYLNSIQWRISHCYREGNVPADVLANRAAYTKATEKWNDSPSFIAHSIDREATGRSYYRFC